MDNMMASDLSAEPVLRIETGMHTARINRIDTDAADKILITAADDKTVRMYKRKQPLPTLHQIATAKTKEFWRK
jgi:WD40 repeat protein